MSMVYTGYPPSPSIRPQYSYPGPIGIPPRPSIAQSIAANPWKWGSLGAAFLSASPYIYSELKDIGSKWWNSTKEDPVRSVQNVRNLFSAFSSGGGDSGKSSSRWRKYPTFKRRYARRYGPRYKRRKSVRRYRRKFSRRRRY